MQLPPLRMGVVDNFSTTRREKMSLQHPSKDLKSEATILPMIRIRLLMLSLFIGSPALALAASTDQPEASANFKPTTPLSETPDPESSALSPIISRVATTPIKAEVEDQQALNNRHDDELFSDPNTKEVLPTDPFSQEAAQPLPIAPQKP
jgi:hypothetical protein